MSVYRTIGPLVYQSELTHPIKDQTRMCIWANYRVGIYIKFAHFVRSSAEEIRVLINRLFSYFNRYNKKQNIFPIHTLQ